MKTQTQEKAKTQTPVVLVLTLEQAREIKQALARTTSDQSLITHLEKKIQRAVSGPSQQSSSVTISGPDEQVHETFNQRKRPQGARR